LGLMTSTVALLRRLILGGEKKPKSYDIGKECEVVLTRHVRPAWIRSFMPSSRSERKKHVDKGKIGETLDEKKKTGNRKEEWSSRKPAWYVFSLHQFQS